MAAVAVQVRAPCGRSVVVAAVPSAAGQSCTRGLRALVGDGFRRRETGPGGGDTGAAHTLQRLHVTRKEHGTPRGSGRSLPRVSIPIFTKFPTNQKQ